jgi:hypothetical protein
MMRTALYEAAQVMLLRSAKWSWLKAWATVGGDYASHLD